MPKNEFGDFQTPLELARQCLKVLELPERARVLEPTCGTGAFLRASSEVSPASERLGIEVQEDYAELARKWGDVSLRNIFETDLSTQIQWDTEGPLYVVGNPPWVTSAELRRMDSKNLPPKENFKGAKGIEALLGGSNFDVCEYILLKALRELKDQPFTMAMLCKSQVARNVLTYAAESNVPVAGGDLYRIDAMKWFGAAVDACWFVLTVDPVFSPDYTVNVYDDIFKAHTAPVSRFGMVDGAFVSNVDKYAAVRVADGESPYVWRSGLKHDASAVFELKATPTPETRAGEPVDVEDEYLFPLLKGTDVFRGRERDLKRWVVVPQKQFGDETSHLQHTAPKLWGYLTKHAEALDGRKSSIYRKRPRFSVFGHGDYTYAPFKIAVSGLHKAPVFKLITPMNEKPVVLDDTCYFIPIYDETEACLVTAVLNSPECTAFIESLVFWDSKRPITKKLLTRLNLNKLPINIEACLDAAKTIATERGLELDEEKARASMGRLGITEHDGQTLFQLA